MSETNKPQQAPVQTVQPSPEPANPFGAPVGNPQQPQQHEQGQYVPSQQKMGDQLGMRVLLPVGRSGWAIAAGYLGLLSVTLVLAPLAIICSIIALVSINKSKFTDNKKRGMGRAIFGLIMGVPCSVLLVSWLLNR